MRVLQGAEPPVRRATCIMCRLRCTLCQQEPAELLLLREAQWRCLGLPTQQSVPLSMLSPLPVRCLGVSCLV